MGGQDASLAESPRDPQFRQRAVEADVAGREEWAWFAHDRVASVLALALPFAPDGLVLCPVVLVLMVVVANALRSAVAPEAAAGLG